MTVTRPAQESSSDAPGAARPVPAAQRRTALVTGGTGGLGRAVTAAFLAAGWRTVVPVRNPTITSVGAAAPLAVAADLSDPEAVQRAVPVTADLSDPEAVARAVSVAAGDPAAPLRAVVNLVGGYAANGLVHETPVTEFERMLTLNLRPTYLVTAAALPHLVTAGTGSVVCVSSRAAVAPFPGAAGYVTAKAAVIAFAGAVAVEYKKAGVRCNTVLPSVIDTPANRAAMPTADHGQWVPPEEVAKVVLFLAGEESAPVSGASVPVYGRA